MMLKCEKVEYRTKKLLIERINQTFNLEEAMSEIREDRYESIGIVKYLRDSEKIVEKMLAEYKDTVLELDIIKNMKLTP